MFTLAGDWHGEVLSSPLNRSASMGKTLMLWPQPIVCLLHVVRRNGLTRPMLLRLVAVVLQVMPMGRLSGRP